MAKCTAPTLLRLYNNAIQLTDGSISHIKQDGYLNKIDLKTEYAGRPKGHIKPKTESETVNGNGAERQKRTYMAYCVARAAAIIYAFILTWLLILPLQVTYMKK